MKPLNDKHLAVFRRHMVETIDIEFDVMSEEIGRDRIGERLRAALLEVPRHLFVPGQIAALAYQDRPLPIGFDKTISQPFLSALMLDLLDLSADDRVLEVGTGLGYQAAVLAELVGHVWTVDIVEEFTAFAEPHLRGMGYDNVTLRVGDGSRGWPDAAPFDAILVTAGAPQVPQPLAAQLKPGGRLVMPLGEGADQRLARIEKQTDGNLVVEEIMAVKFTDLETVF